MLTSTQIARLIEQALRAPPHAATPASPFSVLDEQRVRLARIQLRGTLSRLRAEMATRFVDVESWKVQRLPHGRGYRLQRDSSVAHLTLTYVDAGVCVETLARAPSSRLVPFSPTTWLTVSSCIEGWLRDLLAAGMLMTEQRPLA